MLQALFQNTVSALCYELAAEQGAAAGACPLLGPPYNDITRFVLEQHGRMPQVLSEAVRLATVLFAVAAIPRGGLFHRLPPERRRLQVTAWSACRLSPCRDLMKLYSSLAILALYSRPGVERAAEHCG
jgi:hypothetical protein